MDITLVLIGVACIVGAIAGGGVKLVQVELNPVTSLWRQGLLAAFGAVISILGLMHGGYLHASVDNASPAASQESPSVPVSNSSEANLDTKKMDLPPRPAMRAQPKPIKRVVHGSSNVNGATPKPCYLEKSIKSTVSEEPRKFVIINSSSSPVKFNWLNFNGNRVYYGTVMPGSAASMNSFLTHPWLLENADGSCLGIWMAGDTADIR